MPDATDPAAPNQAAFDEKVRERAEKLAGTIHVHQRYDWGDDLLTIDPDDLLVDRPEVPAHDEHAAHPSLNKIDFERFVNEAYVGRVLTRGEVLLESEMALDLRQELKDCLEIIEDLSTPAHVIGFHVGVMAEAARQARAARLRREAEETVTDETRAAAGSLLDAGESDFEDRAGVLMALGSAAWPALEAALTGDSPDEGVAGVVKVAARMGGARAIRFAMTALERVPAAPEVSGAVVQALQELGDEAGWSVIGRLHYEGLSPEVRRSLLEVALETEDPLAVTLVIHEALQAIGGDREDLDVHYGLGLARMLVARGDRRSVPLMAFIFKGGDLPKEAHDLLVETLQENGLWGDVSEVIASLKTEWPLVLPSGVSYEAFTGHVAEREGVDLKDQEALNALLEKTRLHWEKTYREDLGYLRTCDGDRAGPIEQDLMRQFTGEASHLAQDAQGQERMKARIENYREEWMRTPLRSLDGGLPIAAILQERIAMQPGGMGRARARRTILARTLNEARTHLAGKRKRRAKASMAVLDALAPDYPPAVRFRKELGE